MTPASQPTLRDGDVVLRPWSDHDIEVARLQHDDEMAKWFDFPHVVPSFAEHTAAVARWREQYDDDRRTVSFVVERAGRIAGSVEVRRVLDHVGELSWTLYSGHRGLGTARRAVRLLIAYCFDDLQLRRIEAHVDPDNVASLRLASRVGLRREGLARGRHTRGGQQRDEILLGRLATDPPPESATGFRALLNGALPRKRVIAQGVLRDVRGRVLLCELTYKPDWDLPGGVVESGESPRDAVVREVEEELGLTRLPGPLVAVDWLPPWSGWDDACLLVFDLGTVNEEDAARVVLEPREIAAVHWCEPLTVAAHSRGPTSARVVHSCAAADSASTVFLHAGQPAAATT